MTTKQILETLDEKDFETYSNFYKNNPIKDIDDIPDFLLEENRKLVESSKATVYGNGFEVPVIPVTFNQYSLEEIKSILGRQWKKQLVSLKTFISLYTISEVQTIVPISTTSKRLLKHFQKKMNISNLLKAAISIDLIKPWNETFQFGSKSKSKTYIFNYSLSKLIKSLEDISYNKINNNKYHYILNNIYISSLGTIFVSDEDNNNLKDKVIFSSKLRINKTKIVPNEDNIYNNIINNLYSRYNQLLDYMSISNEINNKLPLLEQISFLPKIKESEKYITKIGIRATSSICNSKKETSNKEYNGLQREDYLKSVFGDSWNEHDEKASIYKITYLLNTGKWLDNDVDLYKEIYKEFKTKEERDTYKQMTMSLYFDKSPKSIINHNKEASQGLDKSSLENSLQYYIDKMKNTIGKTYDNEIFLHESCIYMEALKRAMDLGVRVVQIYDGFYFDKDIDFANLIKESALYYYTKYIQGENEMDEFDLFVKAMGRETKKVEEKTGNDYNELQQQYYGGYDIPGRTWEECKDLLGEDK